MTDDEVEMKVEFNSVDGKKSDIVLLFAVGAPVATTFIVLAMSVEEPYEVLKVLLPQAIALIIIAVPFVVFGVRIRNRGRQILLSRHTIREVNRNIPTSTFQWDELRQVRFPDLESIQLEFETGKLRILARDVKNLEAFAKFVGEHAPSHCQATVRRGFPGVDSFLMHFRGQLS